MSKIPEEILRLSDEQLRQAFLDRDHPVGPVTDTTRKAYQNKLASLMGTGGSRKTATPKKKKQSIAAMSSEEDEPSPPPKAATPKRKSVAPVAPVTPVETTSRRKQVKATPKAKLPTPSPQVSYDTGSDSDEVEPVRDSRRTTHTYYRQVCPSGSPPVSSNPPFMSDFGKKLSLSFNGHTPARNDSPQKKVLSQESVGHSWVYKFFTMVLPVLLVAFFAFLAYQYAGMPAAPKGISEQVEPILKDAEFDKDTHLPVCKGTQVPGINCVLHSDIRPTIENLRLLYPFIKQTYIDAVCSSKADANNGRVDFNDMETQLEARGISDAESVINNIRVLIRNNPDWGFDVVNQGKSLTLKNPSLPTLCFLRLKIAGVFDSLIVVVAVILIMLALRWVHKSWTEKVTKDAARKTALINRIRDRMESTELSNGPFSVPIDQLRDELLGANNVKSMSKVWNEALANVLKYDPEIRMETKLVGGEEADCLVWIRSRSPHSTRVSQQGREATADKLEQMDNSSQSSKEHMSKVWQGQAFENVEGSFNSPPVCPTQCLKIRHMFVPDKPAGSDGVVDAILEKCGQNVNILHIKLDSNANDCCVYMKTASQADAGRAFRALHGWWFDGNLVTVKFLRLERYHERFPEAINACIPLRPSNNTKLASQGKLWQSNENEVD
ncbi:inner nuclear membrane protein Man1 isoform X1 [Cloeon dipterum]|uniref:inner nuclear membrane protein Man1 isoform X1 n=1 Tax=Cloeon dipterum TaxID=197152 RepID=UPI00321F8D12